MKIIDLLNKIANGEEIPKEIKYNACLFAFERQSQDYYCEEYGNLFEYLINEHRTGEFLNDEVEVIEEDKKIKKFELPKFINEGENTTDSQIWNLNINLCYTRDKINEIIDYINKEK